MDLTRQARTTHRLFLTLLLAVGAAFSSGFPAAHAVHPTGTSAQAKLASGDLVVAGGTQSRSQPMVQMNTPTAMLAPWTSLIGKTQARWVAMWDRATNVPRRIYGEGINAPGSVANETLAALTASEFLATHIELLAPGSTISDFTLVSNQERHGVRVVGFVQSHRGLRVYGGQVSFRFKNDRLVAIGSEALPNVSVSGTQLRLAATNAPMVAAADIGTHARLATATKLDDLMILPIVANDRVVGYHTVVPVTVKAADPIGSWQVYIDAGNGSLVGKKQTLMFADGNVLYNTPVRQPGAARLDYSANLTVVRTDGEDILTDAAGLLTWPGDAAAAAMPSLVGTFTDVNNVAGDDAVGSFTIAPDGDLIWNESGDEFLDAQITTYVHAQIVKDFARVLAPDLPFLDTVQVANVNIDDSCNAFSDGTTINFFRSSSQCSNTARLPDVVYHEFGHSLHANSVIEGVGFFNGAHSEGLSDFLAAAITGDPAMGVGFFRSDAPLRHIDPVGMENRWPEDVAGSHFTGLIFSGAMWDLRKILIQKLGEEEGIALVNRLFYATLERATDIPSTYVEVLIEDDDDGNLLNGTPNVCDINSAFGAHGLRNLDIALSPLASEIPDAAGHPISVALSGLYEACPGDQIESVTLGYKLQSDTEGELQTVPLAADAENFSGVIPTITDGEIVNFRVDVHLADLNALSFPNNPADQLYQFYVGETVELYCTDFETDPFAQGWTNDATQGGAQANDWNWGTPMSPTAAGDPPTAFSGANVIGNDLGIDEGSNGTYAAEAITFLRSPTIEVMNYTDVHLQYRRWLNVEDGFFDRASIFVGPQLVWSNLNSDMGNSSAIHHEDKEWRFHDVALSEFARGNQVEVRFEIQSDGGLELGGWTIDDLCIVANVNSICGDGTVTGAEDCDDGGQNSDSVSNACRTDCRAYTCGDGVTDSGEQCDDANFEQLDGCANNCTVPPGDGGCGCNTGLGSGSGLGGLLLVLGLAIAGRRRRKRSYS